MKRPDSPWLNKHALHTAGQTIPAPNSKLNNELGRNGCNGQVEPPQPKGRNAEYHTYQGCHGASHWKGDYKGYTTLDQYGAGVSAYAQKGGMT